MKTSLETITLYHLCYFAIISTHSTSTETVKFPGTKFVGVAFELKERMQNLPSCVHVLHKTLNLVISHCCFAEDTKEIYRNLKRICRVIVFAH